ncbi:hypothetical protein Tco_1070773 [Tanacetum coccineum]|uniref:Uncharacterized protein n=1 Tax=Tanacetum coccineum TaxID=301880 RepID=A0ABQ5HMI9_9ASTR
MAKSNEYISVTRKNFLSDDNKGRMLSDCIEEMEADEDDDLNDVADIFMIESNLFDFKTPLCKAFNEFNYLLKIDTNLFTFNFKRAKTYEEYELNYNKMKDLKEPWSDYKVPYQLCDHICEPYRFKKGKTKWPTCSSDIDGSIMVENYLEWFESGNYGANNAGSTQDNKEDHHDPSRCNIRRFDMIKYSFRDDEEYVAVKEDEYDDGISTSKEAIYAYQEIFYRIDEGWMVLRLE